MYSNSSSTPESILAIMNDFPSFSLDVAVLLSDLPEDTVQETLDMMVSVDLLTVGCCSEDSSQCYERVE